MLCLVVAFFGAVVIVVVDVVAAASPFIGIVRAYVDASAVDARFAKVARQKKNERR